MSLPRPISPARTRAHSKHLQAIQSTGKGEVADALLGITDDRANRTRHSNLRSAYQQLRPTGKKNVEEAVAGIARLIDKHARSV